MKAYLDIENSKTQEVITILLPVLEFEENGHIIFDISKVNDKEKKLILDAINPKLGYTDIEMFFIDDDDVPYFGPDYDYSISDNKLILDYKYDKRKHVLEKKNEDWTFMFEEEFNKILEEFLKQSNDYLLVYYDNGVKYKVLDYNPDKDIFMELFFEEGYNAVALFKKNINGLSTILRDNITFIDSYVEDESVFAK
ncbi:MAG: hypothetical protein MR779_00465 [Tenericutes bacterium]|nr:hypothetical protein [Mycoplasmatota bacterium]